MTRKKSAARIPAAFLSVDDTADILGVSPGTVRNLLARGEIDAVKIGRAVRIPIAELERYGLTLPSYLKEAA